MKRNLTAIVAAASIVAGAATACVTEKDEVYFPAGNDASTGGSAGTGGYTGGTGGNVDGGAGEGGAGASGAGGSTGGAGGNTGGAGGSAGAGGIGGNAGAGGQGGSGGYTTCNSAGIVPLFCDNGASVMNGYIVFGNSAPQEEINAAISLVAPLVNECYEHYGSTPTANLQPDNNYKLIDGNAIIVGKNNSNERIWNSANPLVWDPTDPDESLWQTQADFLQEVQGPSLVCRTYQTSFGERTYLAVTGTTSQEVADSAAALVTIIENYTP